jgi:hypothetical protein
VRSFAVTSAAKEFSYVTDVLNTVTDVLITVTHLLITVTQGSGWSEGQRMEHCSGRQGETRLV